MGQCGRQFRTCRRCLLCALHTVLLLLLTQLPLLLQRQPADSSASLVCLRHCTAVAHHEQRPGSHRAWLRCVHGHPTICGPHTRHCSRTRRWNPSCSRQLRWCASGRAVAPQILRAWAVTPRALARALCGSSTLLCTGRRCAPRRVRPVATDRWLCSVASSPVSVQWSLGSWRVLTQLIPTAVPSEVDLPAQEVK